MTFRMANKLPSLKITLDQMFRYFCIITTVIILVNGAMALITGEELVLHGRDVVRILLAALFGVLPLLLFLFFEDDMRRGVPVLRIIHFIITAVLVMGVLLVVEPYGRDFARGTGVIFLLVYFIVYGYGYHRDRSIARMVNKRLGELHPD